MLLRCVDEEKRVWEYVFGFLEWIESRGRLLVHGTAVSDMHEVLVSWRPAAFNAVLGLGLGARVVVTGNG